MISRQAKQAELLQLQALWRRVFGDGPELTGAFWERFPPEKHTRVIDRDGLAAMASWIPVTLEGQPGAYVYAVATAPEQRGRGLCRALLGELEDTLAAQGFAFTALCPAAPSLFDFYARLGYETAFCHRVRRVAAEQGEIAPEEIPPAEYSALREEYLHTPHCVWPETALSYLQAAGTRFYRLPDGCAAVSDGPLRISELLGPPEHAAALCHCLGASGAEVSAPGMETPHGMVKSLRFGQKTPPAYLGFAFD